MAEAVDTDEAQPMTESAGVRARLEAMGFSLPAPRQFPSPNRRGCVQVGDVAFLSGHGPHHDGMDIIRVGKLGADLTVEQGYQAAQAAALAMLSTLEQFLGDLDRVERVVRLLGMVNCAPHFEQMPQVIDGASDLFFNLFGPEQGCHARAAVGMASLPRNQPVEITGEFQIR